MSKLKIHKCARCGRFEPPVNIHGGLCYLCRSDNVRRVCERASVRALLALAVVASGLVVGLLLCTLGTG